MHGVGLSRGLYLHNLEVLAAENPDVQGQSCVYQMFSLTVLLSADGYPSTVSMLSLSCGLQYCVIFYLPGYQIRIPSLVRISVVASSIGLP